MKSFTPYPAPFNAVSTVAREIVLSGFAVTVAVLAVKLMSTLATSGNLLRVSRTLWVHDEGQVMPDTLTTYW